jgi:prepilin-type N-terminal cleavage/methylation domain-containing protein
MSKVSDKAFTFVEVMIALAVVSISLVALLGLHLRSLAMAQAAQMTSQAVLLADAKVAEVLACGYPGLGGSSGADERNNIAYDWQARVSNVESLRLGDILIAGLREVSVDVRWKQGPGRRHVRMATYVADRKMDEQ